MFITENGEYYNLVYSYNNSISLLNMPLNMKFYLSYIGFGTSENSYPITKDAFNDVKRVEYLNSYLDSLAAAIRYM